MRIAEIAPPWFTVPPAAYGGIELVVALLADGLVERGHDVTLFASGGSTSKAEIVSPLPGPPDPIRLGNTWDETYHATAAYLEILAGGYDLVHDHSGIVGPALGAVLGGSGFPPVVHTLHGPWTEPARRYYRLLGPRVQLVAISESQQRGFPEANYAGVVPNGIDLDAYPVREHKDDFVLFLGRSNPDKGPDVAVEVAKRAGVHLKMIVKRGERFEQEYWEQVVAPRLSGDEEILESVPHDVKVDLLGRARATLVSIQWPEPFGLVMVESMACGTPVVATGFGAAPEIVVDGETGYVCSTVDELVAAVGRAGELSPARCREHVATRFGAEAMTTGYERLFARVFAGRYLRGDRVDPGPEGPGVSPEGPAAFPLRP
jgi:glycosyltransferase involved in cell wall biosynthesis